MATVTPPAGGDQNRGPALITFFWVEAALAISALSLRFYGRVLVKGLGYDDYVMAFAVALFVIMAALGNHLAMIGGARHLYYLSTEQQLRVVKVDWIAQTFGIAGFAAGKASVALQIQRILGPSRRQNNRVRWTRWLLWFIIASTCLFCGLDCIFQFVQCSPPRALWEPWIPHTCWDTSVQTNFALFLSAWNILIDLLLALIPIPIIWRTSLSLKKRIATCTLLGLGLMAAVCGIVKITFLVSLEVREDLTWSTYDLDVWSASELFVIIVCGCIPPMRPIFVRYFESKENFKGYEYNLSGYGSGQRGMPHKLMSLASTDAAARGRGEEDLVALHSRTESLSPSPA
ncbi:hypothetical protein ASPBRDRAFT_42339 [Aspergillus brasiliensis CBS 101740]|uniref:Rhodopsin domain-containing protein n=1 Tax=Aspergillus brasiliensis (strain CBS 101740 / IMI 381727 / IBT 21946) TaxID=767769 RepID=A0A1L9ULX5_ASPBC|nr:hypothetical protein ASPBRDRAFT_42339 [Aspergillus brasiliensis CBS 101740]